MAACPTAKARLTAAVAEFIDLSGTVVAAPWEGDGHPDHAAAGRAARAAAAGPASRCSSTRSGPGTGESRRTCRPDLARLDLDDAAHRAKELRCNVTAARSDLFPARRR